VLISIGQVFFDKLEDESLAEVEIVLMRDVDTYIPIKIRIVELVDASHL
jgi:hypothetical protein